MYYYLVLSHVHYRYLPLRRRGRLGKNTQQNAEMVHLGSESGNDNNGEGGQVMTVSAGYKSRYCANAVCMNGNLQFKASLKLPNFGSNTNLGAGGVAVRKMWRKKADVDELFVFPLFCHVVLHTSATVAARVDWSRVFVCSMFLSYSDGESTKATMSICALYNLN